MSVSATVERAVRKRDMHCLHCGDMVTTLQHRKNRGMGGAGKLSLLNQPKNLILLCGEFNARIESDEDSAQIARENGWKCRNLTETAHPVLDAVTGQWWVLDNDGGRRAVPAPFDDVPFDR